MMIYGKQLILDAADTTSLTFNRKPFENTKRIFSRGESLKGQTRFSIGVPIYNHFSLQVPGEGVRESNGTMGLSLGFKHFYKEHTAVGFTAGMIAQFNGPLV
jgi:hypothetical protein